MNNEKIFSETKDGMIQRDDIVEVWDDPAKKTYGRFDSMSQIEGHDVYAVRTYEIAGEERRVTYFRHNIRFIARLC